MQEVAIVVVSYNTRELTAACLNSILAGLKVSGLRAEICVVDNASSDGSADMVRRAFPTVNLVPSAENLGFASANNLALDAMHFDDGTGGSEYVILLNPDTEVVSDALGILLRFMQNSPRVGMAGPSLVYADGRFQHSAFRFPSLAQVFFDFFPVNHRLTESRLNGRYPRVLYERGEPFRIDHPLGAAMIIRGDTIRQVGMFDPDFFMYCEEIDWCMRMKRSGWEVYCVPAARMVHAEGQSTRQFRLPMFVELWRSRFRLFRKHYGTAHNWAIRRMVRIGMRAQVRHWGRNGLSSAGIEEQMRAYRDVVSL